MAAMVFLALWAYVMAAFSNPGIVKFEMLAKYTSEDLNKKQLEMIENAGKKS